MPPSYRGLLPLSRWYAYQGTITSVPVAHPLPKPDSLAYDSYTTYLVDGIIKKVLPLLWLPPLKTKIALLYSSPLNLCYHNG
eukprot:15366347-Ditylum_brightwellii.AAC.1